MAIASASSVAAGQLVERVAEPLEVVAVGALVRHGGVEGGELELPAALDRLPAAYVIDHQATHHPGGVGHEARAVREGDVVLRRNPQIGFVQQRRRAKRQLVAAAELAPGLPVELGVQGREQLLRHVGVTALGRCQQRRDRRLCHRQCPGRRRS
jgi:hypothetical protein